ncbi:hypothetical protein LTR10_004369 [Elasticomyces elasticus]|nr:hypothetical protein LTR10_004369 [Elasticomyces elasticus]KAK4976688.1 hypothetical protein LTR42_002731 [Elasticomyces elasticus]
MATQYATQMSREEYLNNGYSSVSSAEIDSISTERTSDDRPLGCSICMTDFVNPIRLHDVMADDCRHELFASVTVIEHVDSDAVEDDSMLIGHDLDDNSTVDVEILVGLRHIGSRLRQQVPADRRDVWWRFAGSAPMESILNSRARHYLDGTLDIQRYPHSYARTYSNHGAYPSTSYRLDSIALSDRLNDAYLGRLYAALGIVDTAGSVYRPTAACHPIATIVYNALTEAIRQPCADESRLSPAHMEQFLQAVIERNPSVRNAFAKASSSQTMPSGMEEHVRDLISEVVDELMKGEVAPVDIPAGPQGSPAAELAATGRGMMSSMKPSRK